MSQPKKCIFVKERTCPFQSSQINIQTCQLCIEAWKTEVAIKKQQQQIRGMMPTYTHQPQQVEGQRLSVPAINNNGTSIVNERLKELDELLKNDQIDPLEYIRRRKEQVETIVGGEKPRLSIEEIEEAPQEILPVPRIVRVAVVAKSLLGKQIYTAPEDWELPSTLSGKVVDSIFKMMKKRKITDIKLGAGDYKIAGIIGDKDKFAIMVLDADEEFETYESEIERVYEILSKEKIWAQGVKKIHA